MMMTTARRVVGRLADAARKMNEAQRLTLALQTATDRSAVAPDTYDEFLARTSGFLLHEPSARKRIRSARRSSGRR